MKQTLQVLDGLGEAHEDFQEYRKLIDLVMAHREDNPDICIESCKSLFEGIAHMVLRRLDQDYSFTVYKEKSVHALVNMMFTRLKEQVAVEEHAPVAIFAKEIGAIRNARGEVSHGKPYPKDSVSEVFYARMVADITDIYIAYILNIFFSIKFEEAAAYPYEQYEEFNSWLDEQDGAGMLKSYSRALYELDPVRYETELKNYYPDLDI